ncbi:MAG TPA: glycosyltransferase family 1 protein [Pseudolysinimonas sp.]|nr:glycosyltransferase family 1 protein [Pseudolysinimonas sp.]
MTTLRVIVDDIISGPATGAGLYSEELTRELIRTAPRGARVAGIVAASTEDEYDDLLSRLPGLDHLYKSPLARRELAAAWSHGFTLLPGTGMVHATSLLAPLQRHDRAANPSSQTVVTIHDAIAFTNPELLPGRSAGWAQSMAKRADRYADAVVVPTHAVADELADHLNLGDRVRVIAGAPSTALAALTDTPNEDAAARRTALRLPDVYLLAVAGVEPRKGIDQLVRALADAGTLDIPLLVAGAPVEAVAELRNVARDAGVDPERVRLLGSLGPGDLAAVLLGATVFVQPSLEEGFGLSMVEAFAFGLPVIHSDSPALVEVAAGAGLTVERDDAEGYSRRLGEAIASLLADDTLRTTLGITARDRSRAFSWRDAAEKVWQLHADL